MDHENYIELYEAVYFFYRINSCGDNKSGINENVYKAVMRILAVNDLLDDDEKRQYILDNIISKKIEHYTEFFNKAVNEHQFFFDSINELEYEIYSRYNFQITYEIGQEIIKHINFQNKKVLELGGNSGGLGTAVLKKYEDCLYTVVDANIPCTVGNEFKESNRMNIKFIQSNI